MLTLVIPTKNRSGSLRRTLEYYNRTKFPYKILILDSSNEKERALNQKTISGLHGDCNIEYVEYDQDISVFDKIISGVDRVDAKYLVIIGDDDYIIAGTVRKGVAFLESHPDYSAIHGAAYVFYLKTSESSSTIKFIEPYDQRSVEQDSPAARLNSHLFDYTTTFQSIHRTDLLKANLKAIPIKTLGSILDEMYLTSMDVIQGKTRCLPDLYMLRECSPAREHPPGPARYSRWILSRSFRVPYETVNSHLSGVLSETEKIPREEASEIIDQAYASWLCTYLQSDCITHSIAGADSWMKKILEINEHLKKALIMMNLKRRDLISRMRLFHHLPFVINYYDDFFQIRQSIQKFHQNYSE